VLIAVPSAQAQTPPQNDPLYIRLAAHLSPPRAEILDGAGQRHSSFEVYMTNSGATPMKITGADLSAIDAHGRVLWTEQDTGGRLAAMFRPAGGQADESPDIVLQPSASGVLFCFPDLPPGNASPTSFASAITLTGAGPHGGSGIVHLARIAIDQRAPFVIEAPVRGADWLAANGPSNTSDHRRAILFYGGAPFIGQRYAIDWVELGADGHTYTGDKHNNASYHAYNLPIHAVADGTIVAVKDHLPENVPNSTALAITVTDATIAGNHIIEDLGSGHFAAYAHLRPGTITVKTGQRVHAGEVIAHLGNTGNSSEPHLHFQLCDAPSFLHAEGLPFAIDKFVRQEYILDKSAGGQQRMSRGATHQVTREEPMENELDSFGGN